MMNILLLSNGAPNYHYFFNSLVNKFHEDGCNVVLAVDSHFSRIENNLDKLGFDIYNFSEYFEKHNVNNEILFKYRDYNLNAALLSDFERAQIFGIWGKKDESYFEKLKSALLSYFEEIFEKHSVDIVLYENVSNAFSHFALFVAQKNGVTYCGIGGSRLPGRFSISSDPVRDNKSEIIFQDIRAGNTVVSEEIREWCRDYLENIENITPDYMKINGLDNVNLVKRYAKTDKLGKVVALIRHSGDKSYYNFQIGSPLRTYFNLFRRNVARTIKVLLLKDSYGSPVDGEQFILYPLHFHPESSTSILAGTYLDEYEVIRNIAFNLPQGLKLYVKDHISAWGYPSLDFYTRLKNLPNVRLLPPNAPTKQLIKKSRAVITLTSTVGYEALLLGKKVFLYGNVFYEFHKDVIRIDDASRIYDLLKKNLADEAVNDKKYNIDFLSAYYLSTKPGSLNLLLESVAAEHLVLKVYPAIKQDLLASLIDNRRASR